ncbi:MAG: HIT family protein [Desulfuromonadales bacterium]|nr:HIT family protein [Desulfuromonadales bacterium]
MTVASHADCPFCQTLKEDRLVCEFGSVFAVLDKHPVTEGHHLVISKRHIADFFAMNHAERRDAEALLLLLKKQIQGEDRRVTGFNIGMNCGEVAGQTVMHAHIHLIPRRAGDVEAPRGGVRGCIPGKMGY